MAANLPYEVKRLIYEYVDLETLKSLRLVSASWAVVGLELLFLPCFTVKSFSIDVPRLVSIGASPIVARQAARVIKKVKFYSTVSSFSSACEGPIPPNGEECVLSGPVFCMNHVASSILFLASVCYLGLLI